MSDAPGAPAPAPRVPARSSPRPAHHCDVVVLGAGPAGVGVAHRLSAEGHDVTVVERADRVGGASASFTVAGVRVDHGSHRLHRAIDPRILTELQGLLAGDLQRRERRGRIRLAGRWLPFPLTPAATVRGLPPGFAARAAVEALTSRNRRPRADTFAEIVRAGLGPTMLDRFYGPYARKLWGLDPDEIAGEQARRRVGASSPAALLRRVIAGRDPDARTFLYPRRGFGQIWETLGAAAVQRGADLRLGCAAVSVMSGRDRVGVRLDDGMEVWARRLFSTIPLPAFVRLCGDTAPAGITAAARALQTRAMVLVYLVVDAPRFADIDAHYLPEAWTPVTRISEPKNYRDGAPGSDDPGDPPDRTVLCAEIPCTVGDAYWSADDRDLCRIVVDAITGSGSSPPRVTEVTSRRLPSAYPVYDLGFADRLATVDGWVGSLPRVTTFGRQGLFVHDNSHHALAMAWAAAAALRRDGTMDAAAWAAARERFTHHVVED